MPQLVQADELARTIDVGGDNPARIDVAVVNDILNQVEGYVGTYTGRKFSPEPVFDEDGADTLDAVEKTFKVGRVGYKSLSSSRGVRVRIPDLRVATLVTLDGNELTEGVDYVFDCYVGNEPYTSIKLISWNSWINPWTMLQVQSTLSITGRWGFAEPPQEILGVVRYLSARLYRRRDSMYADQVDTGYGLFAYRNSLPEDMMLALDMYKIPQIAVV